MVQKISSTWSIVYSSFHIVKFVPLHLRLCKETLFLLILKIFSWACWEMMMKKLEDWQLTKFKFCEKNHYNTQFQMAISGEVMLKTVKTPKMLLVKATLEYFKFPSSILMHGLFIKWSL